MSGDCGGREGVKAEDARGGCVHLLILLVEVGEGARDEAAVTVPLHSSSDGECLA